MLDGVTISLENLAEIMRSGLEHPKTSTPSMGNIKKMFEFLSQTHKHVFAISISAQMSSTHKLFTEVARSYDNISVIDSRRNSGAHGSVVEMVAKRVKAGLPYQQILEQIKDVINSTDIFVLVDNFKTMQRSGRVSKSKAWFADFIHLKPLVGLDDLGRGKVIAKTVSLRQQKQKLIKQLQRKHALKPISAFKVLHVDNLQGAKRLQSELADIFGLLPCDILHASAAVSLHAGIGTLAVSIEQG
jgi:DegV family protein with EDD domain